MYMYNERQFIAGPCAVESYEQLDKTASFLKKMGVKYFRAGAFKPRTSPDSFQGLGRNGIDMISEVCNNHGMISVSEVLDIRDIDYMRSKINILQVGSRNMFNYELLKELGKIENIILLKRSLMAKNDEFFRAAEYIAKNGNSNIIMCERGIRTFETDTRNTLDLSCVAILKEKYTYPVVVDLSHSLGRKDIAVPMGRAAYAVGADFIMVEVHPDPQNAKSDADQQMDFDEFLQLHDQILKC